MSFEPVIGLEIHIQLKTRRKMFCDCAADVWQAEPNTHVCPVCLGLPGALPVVNQKAMEQAIKVGLALGCEINEINEINKETYFERKNYFYPDLPKGYQISQYRAPLCVGGQLAIQQFSNLTIPIGITRVHLEEDTAKSIHTSDGTLLDFNKSGIPLLEIVSEPDIHSVEAAKAYSKAIQELVRRLGVSDADMEKGQMRLEANISLRELKTQNCKTDGDLGQQFNNSTIQQLPSYRVEIKNINSFRFLEGALKYEIERQTRALEKGEKLEQETRGYDVKRRVTFVQRTKEEAHDYRYFPEPDIPPLEISEEEISRVQRTLPKMKDELIEQLIGAYEISEKDAKILVGDENKLRYFKDLVAEGLESKQAANLVINRPEVLLTRPHDLVRQLEREKAEEITDEDVLRKTVKAVIAANPQAVKDFRSGKEAALKSLIGQVMRETKGRANPQVAEKILRQALT